MNDIIIMVTIAFSEDVRLEKIVCVPSCDQTSVIAFQLQLLNNNNIILFCILLSIAHAAVGLARVRF